MNHTRFNSWEMDIVSCVWYSSQIKLHQVFLTFQLFRNTSELFIALYVDKCRRSVDRVYKIKY